VSIFENDRPLGYDDEKDGEARIHPEPLGDAEKLAMDAKDVEEFVEHFGQEDGPIEGGQSAP
jgi:hypothetical protein